MKVTIGIFFILLLFACSDEDSNGVGGNGGGGIDNNFVVGVYSGTIAIDYSGGYTGTAQGDTLIATATRDQNNNIYISLYEQSIGLAFAGITDGQDVTIPFVANFNDQPDEMSGTINNSTLLLISQSGTFTVSKLNLLEFKGHFEGVFTGYYNSTQAVTVDVSGTFDMQTNI